MHCHSAAPAIQSSQELINVYKKDANLSKQLGDDNFSNFIKYCYGFWQKQVGMGELKELLIGDALEVIQEKQYNKRRTWRKLHLGIDEKTQEIGLQIKS